MKDIVEKILKEEERAGKIVQDAKEEAGRILKEAIKEKENIISRSVSEADDFSRRQKEDSEKRAISEKEKVLTEARKEIALARGAKEKDISGLSAKIFSRIITIEN